MAQIYWLILLLIFQKIPVVFDLYDVYVNMKRMNIKFVLMDDGLYQTKDI